MILTSISVFGADPTCTSRAPSANANINGSRLFNVSVDHGNYSGNVSRINFSSDVNGQMNHRNLTNATDYNITFDTTSLTNGAHTITAQIYLNTTYTAGGTCTVAVTVDNTAPTCTRVSVAPAENIRKGSQLEFTVTASDTTAITYSTVLTLYNGDSATLTGSTNTFTAEQTNVAGRATLVTTLTDVIGQVTTCSTVNIDIGSDSTASTVATTKEAVEGKSNKGMIAFIILMIVIIVVVIVGITLMKKGKKR